MGIFAYLCFYDHLPGVGNVAQEAEGRQPILQQSTDQQRKSYYNNSNGLLTNNNKNSNSLLPPRTKIATVLRK